MLCRINQSHHLITLLLCWILLASRLCINADALHDLRQNAQANRNEQTAPAPTSNENHEKFYNVDENEPESNTITSATQAADIIIPQEKKPPSGSSSAAAESHASIEELDDLQAAIAANNNKAKFTSSSDDAEKTSSINSAEQRADRVKRQQQRQQEMLESETMAWNYFLGTQDFVQNIAKARETFLSLADEGSASAQFGLGVMYATGIGMNISQAKALLYYTQAAWGDYQLAWMALAFRYFTGHTVDYNCDVAALYYHNMASHVIDGLDFLGGLTVTRTRLGDDMNTNDQVLDPEFVQYYQYLAEKGEASAQLALGLLYLQGKHGVEQDMEHAYDYLMQASENDNAQANAYLGKMYLKGTSVTPQDYEQAYEYFHRAAAKESPMGMVGLGLMYSLGYHVEINQNRAKTLFTKAAEQGNADGQLQLGNFLFRSQAPSSLAQMLSSVKNMRQAVKYWNLASQQGNALAYYNLGIAHVYGHGTPRMCRIGTEFLKIVAERGRQAQYFISAYEDYRLHDNIDSALAKYALLTELGYETAASNLAYLYERKIDLRVRILPMLFSSISAAGSNESTIKNSPVAANMLSPPENSQIFYINKNIPLDEHDAMRRAFFYWSQSAELGYAQARIRLGDYHFYGTGTTVNYAEALQHYRAAADAHHNAQAMFNLGYMHEKGLGGKRDLFLAKRYYDLAIDTTSDAYLPSQLALAKLSVVFLWQQIKDSQWYGAMLLPRVEYWLGRHWDLVLSVLAGMLLGAAYLYVRMFNSANNNNNRQTRATFAAAANAAAAASPNDNSRRSTAATTTTPSTTAAANSAASSSAAAAPLAASSSTAATSPSTAAAAPIVAATSAEKTAVDLAALRQQRNLAFSTNSNNVAASTSSSSPLTSSSTATSSNNATMMMPPTTSDLIFSATDAALRAARQHNSNVITPKTTDLAAEAEHKKNSDDELYAVVGDDDDDAESAASAGRSSSGARRRRSIKNDQTSSSGSPNNSDEKDKSARSGDAGSNSGSGNNSRRDSGWPSDID